MDIPSVDVIRHWVAWIPCCDCEQDHDAERVEMFEAWLAEVKAKVWDECAQEAYDRGMLHDITFEDMKTLNRYRQGEEQ